MNDLNEVLRVETGEEIDCPDCGEPVPVRYEICPHCEFGLH